MNIVRPTMADVARMAGVSPTTAARAVHGNGYISVENREAVLGAIATLGYRPNRQARSLRMQRSQTLGLIYSDQENPVFTKLSHAIRLAASKLGYSMLTVDHDASGQGEAGGIGQFLDHRVDTVISCNALDPAAYIPLTRAGIPLVQIERVIMPNTHLVAFDPRSGMGEAVAALTALGHRYIGFIGGIENLPGNVQEEVNIEQERADTFRAKTLAAGLPIADCPIVLGHYFGRDSAGKLSGDALARDMLAGPVPVTAIISGSDVLAAGVLQALYALGLRVPEDISLIGHDDTIAELLSPPLASIRLPYNQIGSAVMQIVAQADGPLMRLEVGTRLVHRPSIGPARERTNP